MKPGGLPPAVRRYLRRPLLWAVLGLAVASAFLAVDVTTARGETRRLASALPATGLVAGERRVGPVVPVTYEHPVTGQRVTADVRLWRAPRPVAGATVRLAVDPDDPGKVTVAGDRFPATGRLGAYVWLPVLPLVAWSARRAAVRRTRRLVAASRPVFAMLAMLRPPGWPSRGGGRRCELALYPLDARPGTSPLCVVPLLTTAELPLAGSPFVAEVKGSPRPGGAVVARRAEGELLWPAGRALLRGGDPFPAVDHATARWEAPPAVAPRGMPRASWWPTLGVEILGVALGAAFLAAVTTQTLAGAADVARFERSGVRVVATVTDLDHGMFTVDVSYRPPGERADRTATIDVDWPGDFRRGWRYPLVLEPGVGDRLRLPASGYDVVAPIGFAAFPLGVALLLLGQRVTWRARVWRVARRGPWRPVDVRCVQVGVWDRAFSVAPAGDLAPRCSVRVPTRQAAMMPATQRWRLEAAGRLEPGEAVALRGGGRVLAVSRPAGADGFRSTDLG